MKLTRTRRIPPQLEKGAHQLGARLGRFVKKGCERAASSVQVWSGSSPHLVTRALGLVGSLALRGAGHIVEVGAPIVATLVVRAAWEMAQQRPPTH